MRAICVVTHRDAAVTAPRVADLIEHAAARQVDLRAAPGEGDKHPQLAPAEARTRELGWPDAALESSCVLVLGGDGTLLRVLNRLRDGPPVVGVNFGTLGYLTASGADALAMTLDAVVTGQIDVIDMGVLQVTVGGERFTAVNDVIAAGPATGRIIQVRWSVVDRRTGVDGQEVQLGDIACDGMVASTAVGSTAYNLSNGGPILDWGVDSFVVGFVAPHMLAARPLVLPRGRAVRLTHLGRGAGLRVLADGESVATLGPGASLEIGLSAARARLGLLPGTSGLGRYRERFLAGNANPFDVSRVDVDLEPSEHGAGT